MTSMKDTLVWWEPKPRQHGHDFYGRYSCLVGTKAKITYLMTLCVIMRYTYFYVKFCYGVYNQCESFIWLDLMVKNREVSIERYFKW
jgi:hypothetical protein